MNILSLFDGMSCGQIALNRIGISYDNYYASEIDKHAIKVTQANYPDTIQLGDVMKLKTEELEPIDLLIGGSPCQSFSFAGKRKGMSTKDEIEILTLEQYLELKENGFEFEGQSFLFWEYMKILKEVKPKYFLLENVKMSKKWEKILSEAIGVEPILINSSLVTAQNRKRLYWTNIPNIEQPENKGLVIKDIFTGGVDITERFLSKKEGTLAYTKSRNSVKTLLDKAKCLTTGGQNIANSGATNIKIDDKYYSFSITEQEALQTVPKKYTNHTSKTQRARMIGNGWTIDVIAHIFKNIPDLQIENDIVKRDDLI